MAVVAVVAVVVVAVAAGGYPDAPATSLSSTTCPTVTAVVVLFESPPLSLCWPVRGRVWSAVTTVGSRVWRLGGLVLSLCGKDS